MLENNDPKVLFKIMKTSRDTTIMTTAVYIPGAEPILPVLIRPISKEPKSADINKQRRQ